MQESQHISEFDFRGFDFRQSKWYSRNGTERRKMAQNDIEPFHFPSSSFPDHPWIAPSIRGQKR